ncbi:hypothetical protein DPMN_119256 [Dreissena polymorpha]|uniref:DUF7869 domain-containing protein n=1 Tax=Dreissena polymorpha TaxID=45954 RepID=A0A9D4JMJ3_DREPO|nr:hypothetical protein DPMN_119256 [Dreissena polymorpha]
MPFLIVGHTHEDIDAKFNEVSRLLNTKDAEYFDDFVKVLKNAERITLLFDVKSWIDGELNKVDHVTQQLHFKFVSVDGGVKVFYKGIQSQPWSALNWNFLNIAPSGKPGILKPNFSKIEIDKNVKQIEALKLIFKKQDSRQKWLQFYESLNSNMERLDSGEFRLTLLPRQPIMQSFPPGQEMVPKEHELIEKENRQPLVSFFYNRVIYC